jgi:sigma-B regulation protein RsbU (phosphoserine phosphatase)
MRQHLIVFVACEGAEGVLSRAAATLREAWPGTREPQVQFLQIEGLRAMIESREARAPRPSAVCAVLGTQERPAEVDRLLETLESGNIPALCLSANAEAWHPFQRGGILFQRHDLNPAVLAGMLFTLAERQSAVESLSREVYLAQRCQGGIRMEIDRLHEEMHMAAAVQRELLPTQMPDVPGLDFGMIFRPVNYVSGDIYDVQRLDADHVGFFIADAVGHGVPAALLTMILTYSLAPTEGLSGEIQRIIEPGLVLKRLNDRLSNARAGSGRFATAVYGVINVVTRRVRIAGAGHPPPLLMRRGESRAIETEGPLLGVFPDAVFDQVEFTLEEGQTLLLYTDGLECAFPSDSAPRDRLHTATKRYLDHFRELVAGEGDASPHTIMDELTGRLDEQAGSLHQSDDVTALAISPRRVEARRLAA